MAKITNFLKTLGHLIYIFFLRWGFLCLSAIFLTWYLQYRVAGNDADSAWAFWDEKPAVFWYTTLIIFCLTTLLYGIFRRPFRTLGVAFAICTILTYINNAKVAFRGTPLLPEDFQLADQTGTLTKFIDYGELVRIILASALSVFLGFFLDRLAGPRLNYFRPIPKLPKKKKLKTKKARRSYNLLVARKITFATLPRLLLIPLAIWGFFTSTEFIRHHDGKQFQDIDWLDTQLIAWDQTSNYAENGFVLGFLYNVEKVSLSAPEDYNATKIASIKDVYTKEAEADNKVGEKTSLKDADYNIVIILNESFYDPSLINEIYHYTGEDPLPTFHNLMKNYPSGYMYSPDYGGGTATIEFEVDTGLSNNWAQTVPYTDIVPKLGDIISIAKEAKSADYQTTAIHSFTGGMYKRNIALAKEGFDKFITEDEMAHKETEANMEYISDRSTYLETLDVLKNSDQKQLVSVITMQNHAPYNISNFDEYNFGLSDLDWDPGNRDAILAYLQSVHRSDQYLGEFLNELSKLGEKTVVLFYGDHAPGVFPLVIGNSSKEISDLGHLTPYFVWTSFSLPEKTFADKKYGQDFLKTFGNAYGYDEEEALYTELGIGYERDDTLALLSEDITLPTTTPNCLTNALYGVLNLKRNAEKTLLRDVCSSDPILTPTYLGETLPSSKTAHDYELLNYDIQGGEQYWLKK